MTPGRTLDVNGDGFFRGGNLFVDSSSSPGRTYEIRCGSRQEVYNNNDFVHFSNSNLSFVTQANPPGGNDDITFHVNNTSSSNRLMHIDGTSRNVGIGTTTGPPSERLEVCGNILAKGDIMATGAVIAGVPPSGSCPDYVFEKDYVLMPLDELRAFLASNKHLPNVPSAAEIERDGLNLGEFQMRLLEKVEELTLYTLQQHEVIEEQHRINEGSQGELDALKARLAALEAALGKGARPNKCCSSDRKTASFQHTGKMTWHSYFLAGPKQAPATAGAADGAPK